MLAVEQDKKFMESGVYVHDSEEILIGHRGQSSLHELT
jgi:hypothetical protein